MRRLVMRRLVVLGLVMRGLVRSKFVRRWVPSLVVRHGVGGRVVDGLVVGVFLRGSRGLRVRSFGGRSFRVGWRCPGVHGSSFCVLRRWRYVASCKLVFRGSGFGLRGLASRSQRIVAARPRVGRGGLVRIVRGFRRGGVLGRRAGRHCWLSRFSSPFLIGSGFRPGAGLGRGLLRPGLFAPRLTGSGFAAFESVGRSHDRIGWQLFTRGPVAVRLLAAGLLSGRVGGLGRRAAGPGVGGGRGFLVPVAPVLRFTKFSGRSFRACAFRRRIPGRRRGRGRLFGLRGGCIPARLRDRRFALGSRSFAGAGVPCSVGRRSVPALRRPGRFPGRVLRMSRDRLEALDRFRSGLFAGALVRHSRGLESFQLVRCLPLARDLLLARDFLARRLRMRGDRLEAFHRPIGGAVPIGNLERGRMCGPVRPAAHTRERVCVHGLDLVERLRGRERLLRDRGRHVRSGCARRGRLPGHPWRPRLDAPRKRRRARGGGSSGDRGLPGRGGGLFLRIVNLDRRHDLAVAAEHGLDALAGVERELIDGGEVRGIAHRERHDLAAPRPGDLVGEDVQLLGDLLADELHRARIDAVIGQPDRRHAEVLGEGADHRILAAESLLHEDGAELPAPLLLVAEGALELVLIDDAEFSKELP